jgi:phytoene dehydrogenase-like protein
MLGQHVGFPVPEGGAGRITAALVARLAARGGRVECKREVDEMLVARGRAVGVRLADGELIRARQAVLADVPAPSLYLDLIGEQHLPARLVADLANFQWDTAIVKIDWALSGPVPWTAEEARRAGTIHFGVDLDGLTEYSAAIARRTVPHDPLVLAGQMSTADPTRSPAGTETLWAYTHVPRTPPLDAGAAQRHADRVQQLIERHAPGFGELVLARAVEGPSDVAADNPSVPQGSANQGTASIHQQLIFRPVPGLGRADTPIDRLYLAGASAHPGGGVHGGPGANAARAALARAGLGGDAYRAAVRAAHRLVYN